MNENHANLLGTAEWAAFLQEEILSVVARDVELGEDLLEIGPGPGAATDWLRHRVRRLVALELEPAAAAALGERFAGTNVTAVVGDATALPYPAESFDTVGMFTMLHHVPTRALQDAILAGALRALRPGGTLIGSDSLASDRLHRFHEGDTYNPVEPAAFLTRLQTIGFAEITLTVNDRLLFRARKPGAGLGQCRRCRCRGRAGAGAGAGAGHRHDTRLGVMTSLPSTRDAGGTPACGAQSCSWRRLAAGSPADSSGGLGEFRGGGSECPGLFTGPGHPGWGGRPQAGRTICTGRSRPA